MPLRKNPLSSPLPHWLFPAVVAVAYALRLTLLWAKHAANPYYYVDSSSQALYAWWRLEGSNIGQAILGILLHLAEALGFDLFHAPILINCLLGAVFLALVYDFVRRQAGPAVAVMSGLFVISVPAFSRLAFSGELEMLSLAWSALAFWAAAQSAAPATEKSPAWDILAVTAMGLAVQARAELAPVHFLFAGGILWRRRALPKTAALLAAYSLIWLGWDLQNVLSHGFRSAALNRGVDSSFWTRAALLPNWLIIEFFPYNLLLSSTLACLVRPNAALRRWRGFTRLIWGQIFIFWAASCLPLFNSEMERHMCFSATLLMAPASAVLFESLRARPRHAAALALVLALAWMSATSEGPLVPSDVQRSRRLGRKLGDLSQHGALRDDAGVLVLETVDASWPNTLIYSGAPDRFRLLPTRGIDWGTARVWKGGESVAGFVVASPIVEDGFLGSYRNAEPVDRVEDYRIYLGNPRQQTKVR